MLLVIYSHFSKSFGVAIDAWAKADDKISSANHAEGLLMRMEELFLPVSTKNRGQMLSNVPVSVLDYACLSCILCPNSSSALTRIIETIQYNIVIDAWSRRSGCAERAENILRRLADKYEETNHPYLRPGELTQDETYRIADKS